MKEPVNYGEELWMLSAWCVSPELFWKLSNAGIDTAEVKVGDNLKINLNLNKPPQEKDITYLVRDDLHLS